MHGQDSLTVGPSAGPDGRDDLLVCPAADASLDVRRDVGCVDSSKGAHELLAAGIHLPFGLGVTTAASSRAEDILPARDIRRAGGPSNAHRARHETSRKEQSAHGTHANVR